MTRYLSSLAAVLALAGPAVAAQGAPITTTPGQTVQVGYYSIVRPDCSAGAKPNFKLAGPMEHGQLILRPATLKTKRVERCGIVEAPALVVLYKADPTFVGNQTLSYDVVDTDNGNTQRVDVIIRVLAAGDKI